MVNHTASQKRRRLLEELFKTDDEEDEDEETEESDSLEEFTDEDEKKASRCSRGPNKERNRHEGHERLMKDYFSSNSTYNDRDFERRFRLRKELFLKIAAEVEAACVYFVQKPVSTVLLLLLFYFFLIKHLHSFRTVWENLVYPAFKRLPPRFAN